MQKSARILGKDYGLTGQEMNYILMKEGFLEGEPGNYNLTEKGLKFAHEKDFHRGPGGYSMYNRYWTTRTYDDSISQELNITDDLISDVRAELAERRKFNRLNNIAESYVDMKDDLSKISEKQPNESIDLIKKIGLIGIGIICVAGIGYGIYKLVPRIKKRNKRISEAEEKTENEDN